MSFPNLSHPGLDPGPMNTRIIEIAETVFMGPDFRRDDSLRAVT